MLDVKALLKKILRWIKEPLISNSSGDTYYTTVRTDTGTSVKFGVGSGGANHGVWSDTLAKWMIYSNGTDTFIPGIKIVSNTITTPTISAGATAWVSVPAPSGYTNCIPVGWYLDGTGTARITIYNFRKNSTGATLALANLNTIATSIKVHVDFIAFA